MELDPELIPHVNEASRLNNLDPGLLRALISGESSNNPGVTSPAGAAGLTQLMPGAAKGIDPYDPVQAIYRGADILNANLTKAEKLKADGRSINPVEYALKEYFGGPEGPQWGPKTAAYPSYIASRYQAGAPVSPVAALAAAGTKSPGVADGDNGQPYSLPAQFAQERAAAQRPQNGAPMDGLDQLAAAGQPQQPPPPMSDGVMRLAQAGIPSDDELLKGLQEVAPLFQKPQGAPQAAPMAQAAPVAQPAPQPGAAPAGGIPSVSPVPLADPSKAMYSPDLIPHLMTFPDGVAIAGQLSKFAEQGFQLNKDGTLSPIKGGPHDPSVQWQAKAGEAAGGKLQTIGPGGVAPMAGSADSAAIQAGTVDRTKPYDVEPGKTHVVPPLPGETALASTAGAAPGSGMAPLSAVAAPGGGTAISGAPSNDTTKGFNDALGKLGDEANAARRGLYEAGLLKQKLHAIGTSGPLTEKLGDIAALGTQLGVPADTLKRFSLPDGATVQQANALALGLLGEVLKAQFPNRITNTDIAVFKPSASNPNLLQEATDFLIDKSVVPKFKRDIARYGSAVDADMPQTPQHLQRHLNKWDNENPYENFAASKPRLNWNPTTNKLEQMQ